MLVTSEVFLKFYPEESPCYMELNRDKYLEWIDNKYHKVADVRISLIEISY